MAMRSSQRVKYLTVAAMLSALGVVLLWLGSFLDVLDLSTAALASLLCVYAVIELGGAYPWMIWLCTSLLALLLLPQKSPAIFYALFAGFYPIVKEKAEKLPRVCGYVVKLVVFHLSLGVIVLAIKLFLPGLIEGQWAPWMPIALYVLALITFLLFDYALTKLITLYIYRFRGKFGMK